MSQEPKWCYYNHAIIPTIAPHETVDASALESGSLWRSVGGYPLLARWTTDFDCPEKTDWWYIIKDKPFDFMDVGHQYRKKIRKGLKNFDVQIIDPTQYIEELYQVQMEAVSDYSANRLMKVDYDEFVSDMYKRRGGLTFAAFSKEDHSIAGYAYDIPCDSYVVSSVMKTKPSQHHKQVTAALVYSVLDYFKNNLAQGLYLLSGERTIYHPTNHQEYLEKTFDYRKAYCQLHIRYRRGIKPIVACLYAMRGVLKHFNGITLFRQINSVLMMEEIVRRSRDSHSTKADKP